MRDYDDLPYIVIERRSGGFGAFVWGAMIGAGAALLLAPRSGAQTQEDIRRTVNRARSAAEGRVDAARSTVARAKDRIEGQIDTVRGQVDNVREQIDHVKDRIETRADKARDTLESGRRIAHDTRDEIERRVQDVKETYHAAADRIAHRDAAPGATPTGGPDVVIIEVSEERTEGRNDLG